MTLCLENSHSCLCCCDVQITYLFYCVQFIREDLEHSSDGDTQASFHGTDDLISVHELWHIWIKSSGMSEECYDTSFR